MTSGWPFDQFRQITGYDLRQQWGEEMNLLVQRGWGRILPDHFHLTPQGLRFADDVARLFLR